jgi:hypothetical protein
MSEMELDMAGPGGVFGRLRLPQVITKSSGTDVKIRDQEINISNMEAFKAFVKALMQDEKLVLRLENGHATIKALFTKSNIVYAKDVQLKGMHGPKTVMLKTEVDGKEFKNTMKANNPSPVEMDVGTLKQEILNGKGENIAEQKGTLYFMRGETEYVMSGTVTGVACDGEARVVGLGVEEDNWNNLTIPFINTPTTVTDEFANLCKTSGQVG